MISQIEDFRKYVSLVFYLVVYIKFALFAVFEFQVFYCFDTRFYPVRKEKTFMTFAIFVIIFKMYVAP